MAKKITSLTVVPPVQDALPIVPSGEDLSNIMSELHDMDRLPYGRIKIGPGGVNMFQVFEPGEEDADAVKEIEGVIIMSHKSNGLWYKPYSGENVQPDCASVDGVLGVRASTGECIACDKCPYNEFGSAKDGAGRGKACKNMRRLYIMRRGDVFPMVLTLPPTALTAYDNFRVKLMLGKLKPLAVLVRISLKTAKSKDNIAYSTPVFEAVGMLSATERAAVEQYAALFNASARQVTVSAEDNMVVVNDADNPFAEPPAAEAKEPQAVPAPQTASVQADVFQAIE